ncbi:MAG TPA: TetR/AcrR family transcriptional regulator [Clostridia bacterium]|nr:TetR/AcrR family transcriptional regulator [Clostridia bacterium]
MTGQSKIKHNRLIKKAEDLFLKYGYSRVSVDQIAFEAGVSKMTLYKHFHSKENLFIEVMKNQAEYHYKIIMEIINKNYHAIEKVEAFYTYLHQLAVQFPPILTRDIFEHPSLMEQIKDIKIAMAENMWRCILEDGIKKGEIRPLDVDFVCQLLLGLPQVFMNVDYFDEETKMSEFIKKLFDFMKYGMLGDVRDHKSTGIKEGIEDAGKYTHEG